MYCNCMNISNSSYKAKFERVATHSDGICNLCGYYAISTPFVYDYTVYKQGKDNSDLDALAGKRERQVSSWHQLDHYGYKNDKQKERHLNIMRQKRARQKYESNLKGPLVDKIAKSYFTVRRWAKKLKIPEHTLRHWYTELGGPRKKRERIAKSVLELTSKGLTQLEIGKLLHVTPRTVGKYQKGTHNGL